MGHTDKTARQEYARAYYLANRDRLLANEKAYRKTHKQLRVLIRPQALDMLKKLASEDGIPMTVELARLILRESFVRTMARGDRA